MSVTDLPEGYDPKSDTEYMGANMLSFFRRQLMDWKQEIVEETRSTVEGMQAERLSHPDIADTAAATADQQLELRTKDRLRKLVAKIDKAVGRIDQGEYGYCESTGDEIGVGRLMARPIATLSIEAQEAHERGEKTRA